MDKAKKIAEQIKGLVDELVNLTTKDSTISSKGKKSPQAVTYKGASGALTMLTEEGYFDSPKNIATIMEKLKEIGRYYPQPSVSMNLLNLTKRRTFNRIMDKE